MFSPSDSLPSTRPPSLVTLTVRVLFSQVAKFLPPRARLAAPAYHRKHNLPSIDGQKRGDHSCIKVPGSSDVFCMGGFTENNGEFEILQSVEYFDMETETWEFKADMVIPRADFGAG